MNKLEFIDFLVKNNYRYYEDNREINVEEVTDNLGNVDRVFTYEKRFKKI